MKDEKLKIKKNVLLRNYTTFKIGGSAKYFFIAKTKEDIIEAINWAKEKDLPFFILGGGSNILVADEGFEGLIIKILNSKFKILNSKVFVEAGSPLTFIINRVAQRNLTGLEWAVGIPGTVGGAIYGNAGAFGESMSNIVKEIEVFDVKNQKIRIFRNEDCKFGYRDSIFKHKKNLIILSSILKLKKDKKNKILKRMKEYLNYRRKTQPLNFPSAGSVFKNPQRFSAAELIEKVGLKGKKIGSAQISEKHANFIINLRKAKSKDVLGLIKLAKKEVKKKFRIKLEEEIQYLGF